MVAVKLIVYKIKKLEMTNMRVSREKKVLFESTGGMELDFDENCRVATATITLHLFSEKEPDNLAIRLELEGRFIVKGVNGSPEAKKEASVRCYDMLLPYVDQIVNFLAMNGGLKGFSLLRELWIDKNDVRQSAETEGREGEIIEFPEGGDGEE